MEEFAADVHVQELRTQNEMLIRRIKELEDHNIVLAGQLSSAQSLITELRIRLRQYELQNTDFQNCLQTTSRSPIRSYQDMVGCGLGARLTDVSHDQRRQEPRFETAAVEPSIDTKSMRTDHL